MCGFWVNPSEFLKDGGCSHSVPATWPCSEWGPMQSHGCERAHQQVTEDVTACGWHHRQNVAWELALGKSFVVLMGRNQFSEKNGRQVFDLNLKH